MCNPIMIFFRIPIESQQLFASFFVIPPESQRIFCNPNRILIPLFCNPRHICSSGYRGGIPQLATGSVEPKPDADILPRHCKSLIASVSSVRASVIGSSLSQS